MRKKGARVSSSRVMAAVFVAVLLAAEAVTFYLFFRSRGTQQSTMFFGSGSGGQSLSDSFMDFFNVAKYSAGKDPYHCAYFPLSEKAYPPLTYLLMYPFSKVFDYLNQAPGLARGTQLGLMSVVVPATLLCGLMAAMLYDMQKGSRTIRLLTVTALLLSGVSLYSVERGNIVYLAAVCLIYFVLAYRSESPVERELAYIALAVAAALKVFPAIFGVLLLARRQYKEAARTAIYGLAAGFLPFLYFKGGFSNIPQMIQNMKANSQAYMFLGSKRFGFVALGQMLGLTNAQSAHLTTVGFVLLAVALLTFFRLKGDWKPVMLLTCGVLMTPVNSGIYCALYFFIPVALFLGERRHTPGDWLYLVLMLMVLSPYQMTFHGQLVSDRLPNVAVTVIYGLLLGEALAATAVSLRHRGRSGKAPEALGNGKI